MQSSTTDKSPPAARSTFASQWSIQSPTTVFGNLPPKRPAWERQPRQRQPLSSTSANVGRKTRTIWKRNDARTPLPLSQHSKEISQPPEQPNIGLTEGEQNSAGLNAATEAQTPDGKVVKRVRLDRSIAFPGSQRKRGAAVWDRRKNALPHKKPRPGQVHKNNDSVESSTSDPHLFAASDHVTTVVENLTFPSPVHVAHEANHHGPNGDSESDSACIVGLGSRSQIAECLDSELMSTTTARRNMRIAAAKHLEDMREKLCAKSPRFNRRKSEFMLSSIATPQRRGKRRVSTALEYCNPPTLNIPNIDTSLRSDHEENAMISASSSTPDEHSAPPAINAGFNREDDARTIEDEGTIEGDINQPTAVEDEIVPEPVDGCHADCDAPREEMPLEGSLTLIKHTPMSVEATSCVSEVSSSAQDSESFLIAHQGGEDIMSSSHDHNLVQPAEPNTGSSATPENEPQAADRLFHDVELSGVAIADAMMNEEQVGECQPTMSPCSPEPKNLQSRAHEGNNHGPIVADDDDATYALLGSAEKTSTIKVSLNDEDTDILKSFLSRAKASKAAKIANQSSLLNRRDSDVVKHALASPRRALEDLDANSPSPRKDKDISSMQETASTARLARQTPSSPTPKPFKILPDDGSGEADELTKPLPSVRRSARVTDAANSSVKAPPNGNLTPSTISLRCQNNSETVVLKKTEAQEIALLTRTNTRWNKGGALPARTTLLRLQGVPIEDIIDNNEASPCEGRVRWNEDLVAYFEEGNRHGAHQVMDEQTALTKPRARRARMLGAMNGTPARVRSKDIDSTPVDDNDTMELLGLDTATEDRQNDKAAMVDLRTETQNAEDQMTAAAAKREAARSATRMMRRIPTPAKPRKTGQGQPVKHAAATAAAKDDENNDTTTLPKTTSQKRAMVQTRSGIMIASSAANAVDVQKRSMVLQRAAQKAVSR